MANRFCNKWSFICASYSKVNIWFLKLYHVLERFWQSQVLIIKIASNLVNKVSKTKKPQSQICHNHSTGSHVKEWVVIQKQKLYGVNFCTTVWLHYRKVQQEERSRPGSNEWFTEQRSSMWSVRRRGWKQVNWHSLWQNPVPRWGHSATAQGGL